MSELGRKILAKFQGRPFLASLATITEEGKPWSRYVTPTMDEDLTLWVTTFKGSRKVGHMERNPEVHLNTGVTDLATAESYVQIQGRAEVLSDSATRRKVWREELARYFSGPDDPNYVVVKIRPYRIEYQVMAPAPPEVWEA
ncbi:MAG: pyridoxamine 5'-phosphate oxidase family protein [Thermodesulfobacteriota bacterium]